MDIFTTERDESFQFDESESPTATIKFRSLEQGINVKRKLCPPPAPAASCEDTKVSICCRKKIKVNLCESFSSLDGLIDVNWNINGKTRARWNEENKKKKQWKMQSNLPRVLVVQLHLTVLLRLRKLQFRVPNLRPTVFSLLIASGQWHKLHNSYKHTHGKGERGRGRGRETVWQWSWGLFVPSLCVSLCISLLDTSCIQCASPETSWLRWKDRD